MFNVKTQNLKVELPTTSGSIERQAVIDGTLSKRVQPDECRWSLGSEKDKKKLTVTLTKAGSGKWTSVLKQ
jgi:hypothetical protein